MRKVIVLEHITLDGVIQAPGGPDEDTNGGFAYGGMPPPLSDAILGTALRRQMNMPFDLLLGRRTFENWAPYWPQHADAWPGVNAATKYVASNTMTSGEWQPSVFFERDTAEKSPRSSNSKGRICTFGEVVSSFRRSSSMIWSMCFRLMIYPITLGVGKRLFAVGTIRAAFKVTEDIVTSQGVIVVNYERAGAITTGS